MLMTFSFRHIVAQIKWSRAASLLENRRWCRRNNVLMDRRFCRMHVVDDNLFMHCSISKRCVFFIIQAVDPVRIPSAPLMNFAIEFIMTRDGIDGFRIQRSANNGVV